MLLYPCLSFHLFEPDEGRYAEIPREMLVRGEWIIPYLQSEPYLDKPPLLYWCVMISYRVFGVHDWAARLIPALAVHGCILLTYFFGRRMLGEHSAFWAALGLSIAPGFVGMGRLLFLDGLLAFWIVLALFSGFEARRSGQLRWTWWLLCALATALGVLTKGPVAIVLLVPPLLIHQWLILGRLNLRIREWLLFAVVIFTFVTPWYAAMCWRVPEFFRYFFWEHHVVRFLTPFDHERPIWFYLPIVAGGLLPISIVAGPFLYFLLSNTETVAQRRPPELGFMLLAGGWCVFFFSLSGCKLPTYVLPAFPPLALALGYFIAESRWRDAITLRLMCGICFALMSGIHFVAVPWYARFHSPFSRPAEVTAYCQDPATAVVCYPRNCDSVAFYLGRDDFRSYRSKDTPTMIQYLMKQPRTVILFTHRHSMDALRQVLPQALRLTGETQLSGSWRSYARPEYCFMAIVERNKR